MPLGNTKLTEQCSSLRVLDGGLGPLITELTEQCPNLRVLGGVLFVSVFCKTSCHHDKVGFFLLEKRSIKTTQVVGMPLNLFCSIS